VRKTAARAIIEALTNRVSPKVWALAVSLACAVVLGSGAGAHAATQLQQLSGTIGSKQIGLQLLIRDKSHIEAAHYFYVRDLVDIPLQAREVGNVLYLKAADGAQFELRPKAPGQKSLYEPLEGFSGRWTKGEVGLPVQVMLEWSVPNPSDRLYECLTDEPDGAYESKVRAFLTSALRGERRATARFVSYPLRVSGPGRRYRHVRNERAFLAQWDRIFTPSLLRQLRTAVPHEMFVSNCMAMVGSGEAWFDGRGVKALNLSD